MALGRGLRRRRSRIGDIRRQVGVEDAGRRYLLYFTVPLWIGAGLADWACHRQTRIEETAGTHESAVHALMMSEAGVPVMMGLFLEVNAGVLAVVLGALGLHQATAAWDVAYAQDRREVTPTEQHVHGLLEQVPVMATSFLVMLHWDQARALVGTGGGRPDFALRPKRHPLPRRYLRRLLAAVGAFIVAPYGEELWRCYRRDRTLAMHPEAPAPTPQQVER